MTFPPSSAPPSPRRYGETIPAEEFKNRKDIVSIRLSDQVTTVGARAFEGCTMLKDVRFSPYLASIESGAFHDCSAIEELLFPDTFRYLAEEAFSDCGGLLSVTMFKPHASTVCNYHYDAATAMDRFGLALKQAMPWSWDEKAAKAIAKEDEEGRARLAEDQKANVWGHLLTKEAEFAHATPRTYTLLLGGELWSLTTAKDPEASSRITAGASSLDVAVALTLDTVRMPKLELHRSGFSRCSRVALVNGPDRMLAILRNNVVTTAVAEKDGFAEGSHRRASITFDRLPPPMRAKGFKMQNKKYYWSMILHRETDTLSSTQRAWIKNLLTVGSRARLHWLPRHGGPRSEPCVPKRGDPPLPCISNDAWLLLLCFVRVGEMGVAPPQRGVPAAPCRGGMPHTLPQ